MKRFILPNCIKSNTLAGRVFDEDRSIVVNDEDAEKLKLVLVRHYGCTMENVEEVEAEEAEETSLTASVTKDA